jgi:hypothetical protein
MVEYGRRYQAPPSQLKEGTPAPREEVCVKVSTSKTGMSESCCSFRDQFLRTLKPCGRQQRYDLRRYCINNTCTAGVEQGFRRPPCHNASQRHGQTPIVVLILPYVQA